MAYIINEDVRGEIATGLGLVEFDYVKGTVTPNGDEEMLSHLVRIGLASIAEETPSASKPKKTDAAPAAELTTEEN